MKQSIGGAHLSSPHHTQTHPGICCHDETWAGWLTATLYRGYLTCALLGKAVRCRTASVCALIVSTLYAERLRRHGWNEGSLCALVLRLCEGCLLQGSTACCRWTRWREGWEVVLGGGRRNCQANCRLWQLKRRRHRHHGNPTAKSLRSGCCVATATSVAICIWRATLTVWHLTLE